MPALPPAHVQVATPVSVNPGNWSGTDWIEMDAYDTIQVTLKLTSGATAPTALAVRVEATNTASGTPTAAETFEVTPRFPITPAAANQSVDYSVTLCRGAYGDHARYRIQASPTSQSVNVSYIVSRSKLT